MGTGKVVGGGAGIGLGSAIATLIMLIWWPDCPTAGAIALTTVCNTVVALPGIYYAPHNLTSNGAH